MSSGNTWRLHLTLNLIVSRSSPDHCKRNAIPMLALHWRHNEHDGVSNHQPHGCLLNRLFRRRSKKTSKLCVTGLCVGNSPGPVNSPHKGPVTRKMFPFDDVIMWEDGIVVLSRTPGSCLRFVDPFLLIRLLTLITVAEAILNNILKCNVMFTFLQKKLRIFCA